MTRINFELNPTLRCNQACANCNRHCHLKPAWADLADITLAGIRNFIRQLIATGIQVKRLKVAGGEPFIHPEFSEIYAELTKAVDAGLIEKIKIDSNGTLPRPDVADHPAVRWSGRKPSRKAHLPTLWSPTDLGLPIKYPCSMPRKCGISLDHWGLLPCSMAISIVRTFNWYEMYSRRIPRGNTDKDLKEQWDMDKLCRHCVFAGPEAWRKSLCKPLNEITDEEKRPTKTWAGPMGYCVCTCRGGPKDGDMFTAKRQAKPTFDAFAFADPPHRRMLRYVIPERDLDLDETDVVFDGVIRLPKQRG